MGLLSGPVIQAATLPGATGGTITNINNYWVHIFTNSQNFVVTSKLKNIGYLIVGGGGGGRDGYGTGSIKGGGGGGGGLPTI